MGVMQYVLPIGTFAIAIKLACDDGEELKGKLIQYGVAIISLSIMFSVFQVSAGELQSSKELSELVNLLDEKYFVACIDLGHAALNYGTAEDFIRDMNVGDRIKMLHVQECDFVKDSHNFPYSGGYKWDVILKNLKEKGYEGDFSFEIFKVFEFLPDELVLDGLTFTEKIGRFLISKYDRI